MKKSAEATLEKVFGRFRFPFPSSPTHFPSAHRYREDEEPTATSAARPPVPLVALRDIYRALMHDAELVSVSRPCQRGVTRKTHPRQLAVTKPEEL